MDRQLQFSYQMQQSCRVATEGRRSFNSTLDVGGAGQQANVAPWLQQQMGMPGDQPVVDVPPAGECIGQVVLDWEFIHDLDLHLLKLNTSRTGRSVQTEPNPEPNPEPAELDLVSLLDPATGEIRLGNDQALETVVFYGSKTHRCCNGPVQAVLQLDRNAAVHSHKPVENIYLTENLIPGVYVVGVHNYSQRQLQDGIIGPRGYGSFEDFKKQDPAYQMMEKAVRDQNAHVNDEDGTPEKIAIMARVDEKMAEGSGAIAQNCFAGNQKDGVHYGITIWEYLRGADAKHPQGATLEELQNTFRSEFFATSPCVFNAEANTTGYNGANKLADTQTEDGKLALSNKKAAHVAVLKVSKDPNTGKSKISEIHMLPGKPHEDMLSLGSGQGRFGFTADCSRSFCLLRGTPCIVFHHSTNTPIGWPSAALAGTNRTPSPRRWRV